VLACDLAVSSSEATYALPEVTRGIVAAAGGLLRLPRQLSLKVAMEVALTGRPKDAPPPCAGDW
jgi:enoyl-CoA hydratase/carnithine racemase